MEKTQRENQLEQTVFEDSESPCYYPPEQNAFEKAKWNSNGFDQSGMK